MEEKKRISIDIPKDLYKDLRLLAVYDDTTVKLFVEDILKDASRKILSKAINRHNKSIETN